MWKFRNLTVTIFFDKIWSSFITNTSHFLNDFTKYFSSEFQKFLHSVSFPQKRSYWQVSFMLKSILTNKVIATDPVAIKNRQIPTHSFLKKVYLDLIHNTHLKLDPSIRSTDPEWEWATLDILEPR